LEEVVRCARDFDLIHFHVDYLHYPFSSREGYRHVTTLHGRLDIPELPAMYREYGDIPVISISDAQRRPLPKANWRATVYHGLPENLYTYRQTQGEYLAFLGRISPEKGVERAIAIAQRVGMKLKIAAKVDRVDREYFQKKVEPLLNDRLIEFLGEIGGRD